MILLEFAAKVEPNDAIADDADDVTEGADDDDVSTIISMYLVI